LVLASDLKAQPEQAEKTAVDHALSDYSDAFGRGDLSAIGRNASINGTTASGCRSGR